MKLYTQAGGFRAFKILIAAEYTGVEVEVPDFKVGEDNKKPEYLAKNPLGKVRVRIVRSAAAHVGYSAR